MNSKHVLLIRFSALGDIALLIPVLAAARKMNPEVEFTVLTKKPFAPLFERIQGVRVKTLDASGSHRGIFRLFRLYRSLKKETRFDLILDLHQHLRTFFLKFFFRFSDIPLYTIDKRRKARKRLTARRHKQRVPLPHVTELYREVFEKAGLKTADPADFTVLPPEPGSGVEANALIQTHFQDKKHIVGLAPFAHHPTKVWGLDKTEVLTERLVQRGDTGIVIFGGKGQEQIFAEDLQQKYPEHVVSAIGRFSINEEIELMRQTDVMLTMDSANMHLTNLAGAPTVSVWGSTHPHAGFAPLDLSKNVLVQISEETLTCRPCSVFGNKPCFRGDHACMRDITVEAVAGALERVLNRKAENMEDHQQS